MALCLPPHLASLPVFDFGDPDTPRLAPAEWYGEEQKPSFLGKFFKKPAPNLTLEEIVLKDHPMAINMASSLEEHLEENPDALQSTEDDGLSLLHVHCLAGSTPIVEILLNRGANPNAPTKTGMTPLRMAKMFGWSKIVSLLTKAGAKA
jgi:ankyrin repeat protein